MKKFSIRTLLVLVLALVLVFSLVACGDDNGGGGETPSPTPTPAEYTSQEYFTNLWNLSKGIGSEAIAASDNLAVHADLSLALATESNAGKVYQKVDVGFSIDLVLDKSDKAATNESQTALKVRVYDPTDNETWVTLYVFMNDPTCIFVDYAGQNIKIPFNYRNAELSARLDQFLTEDKVIVLNKNDAERREELTIAQLIEKFTVDMGANWNINKLISRVVELTGIDLKTMLTTGTVGSVLEAIQLKDVLFDSEGNFDLHATLTSQFGAALFKNTNATTSGDTTTHYTEVDTAILGSVASAVNGLSKLLTSTTKIALTYNEKNGEIDGFGIKLSLANITAKDQTSVPKATVFPTLSININELSFRKATGNDVTMATARDNYTKDVALDMGVTVDVSGIVLDATAMDARNDNRFSAIAGLDNIALDGQLSLTLKGKVDLWNTTNNETAAVAALSYQPKGGTKVDIVKASFADGTLAVTVNQDAKIGEVPVAKTLVNLFGDHAYNLIAGLLANNEGATNALNNLAKVMFTDEAHRELNPDFVGAAWKNIDIVTPIQNMLDKLNPFKLPVKTDADTAAEVSIFEKIANTIKYAIPYITTPDNNLVIALDNINKNVTKIGGVWDTNMTESGNVDSILAKDTGNWTADLAKLFKLSGAEYTDATSFLKTVLGGSGKLTLDMSWANGAVASVEANVAQASVKITAYVKASTFVKADYEDLAKDVTSETAGWFVLEF